jgi:hypothetical protein
MGGLTLVCGTCKRTIGDDESVYAIGSEFACDPCLLAAEAGSVLHGKLELLRARFPDLGL